METLTASQQVIAAGGSGAICVSYSSHQYFENPKMTCLSCGQLLPEGRKKFCSEECAKTANRNRQRDRRAEIHKHLWECSCGAIISPGRPQK